MATIDIIILIFIGIGFLQGLMQGLLKQVASITGFIVGLLLARALFGLVGEQLAPTLGTSVTVARVIAFILIWVIVPVGFSVIASALSKVLNVVRLGWLNRWLGSGIGAVKFLLLVGLCIHLFEYINVNGDLIPEKTKRESVLYEPIKNLTGIFFPATKGVVKQIFEYAIRTQ